jgi:hypothetical protein
VVFWLLESATSTTGLLDDSIPLPRALARGLFAQKGSGLRSAGVPGNARKASSLHSDESLGYTSGRLAKFADSFLLQAN